MEVRDIIREALSRANIVPRRQPAPFDKQETSLKLLQGIVSQYNNDNYLVFTQADMVLPARRYIHIYDETDTLAGEFNRYFDSLEDKNDNPPTDEDVDNDVWAIVKGHDDVKWVATRIGPDLVWYRHPNPDEFDQRWQQMVRYSNTYHVHVKDVAKLNALNVDRGSQYGMYRLSFLPRAEFDSYINNDLFWTFVQLSEGEWDIETKPYVASCAVKLKLQYNRALRLDLDTDLRVPDAYIELLTAALTHKLALTFPRVDDAQMQRLADAVKVMLDNVKAPKADARQVLRDEHAGDPFLTSSDLMRGRIFY